MFDNGKDDMMQRRMFERIGNNYSMDTGLGKGERYEKKEFSFGKSNSNSSNNCNKISDLNAEYLKRTTMPSSNNGNYMKCSSTSNTASIFGINSNSNNNTNTFSNSNTSSITRNTINVFSNALSHTFQNIPNTFSNLTSPFTSSSSQSQQHSNTFNNVFNINPSPTTYKPKNLNFNRNNPFHIDVLISNFESKLLNSTETIYFKIDLFSFISNTEWSIYHKYSDFYELNLIFKKYYTNAPFFPGDSSLPLSSLQSLIQKQQQLEQYLKSVLSRSDLLTSIYSIKFLKLENHFPDISLYHPLLMYNLEDELDLPISCAYFYEETNLLFLGMGKPSSSVLNGFLSKFKSKIPFLSKQQSPQIICGQLVVYNIIKNYQGLYHFEPLYSKPLYSEVMSINYYKEKNCLCLGMNDGCVQLYKVYITESTEESKGEFIIEAGKVKCYEREVSIVGSVVNFDYGYIYIFGRDICVKIAELNYQTVMKEAVITKKEMSKMIYDDIMGRAIIGDEGGNVYVVDIKTEVLVPKVLYMYTCGMGVVCCLKYERKESRLFVGIKGGELIAFKMKNYQGKYGEIGFMKVVDIMISKGVDVNDVIVNGKEEMMVGLSNGSIPVYCKDLNNPEFVVDAHLMSVSGMFWEEKRKMLITCSEDKSVKMCQFPVYWPGEMIRDANKTNRTVHQYQQNTNSNKSEYSSMFKKDTNDNINNNNHTLDTIIKKEKYSNEDIETWSEDLDGWAYNE